MTVKRLDLVLLFMVGLMVDGFAAYFVVQPAYMDAYYYFGGALQLARGQGFTEPYLWNYLDPIARLPHASHLYWMPLTSMVAAPFMAIAARVWGASLSNAILFRAAQAPLVLAAALLPLLSYAAAWLTTHQRRHAVAAALLTIFSAFYLAFWAQTDGFALYALVAAGALLAGYVGLSRSSGRWLFVAGLGAGLAHLTRTDGVLVLLVVLGMTLWEKGRRKNAESHAASSFRDILYSLSFALFPLFLVLAGYLLVMLPWFVRNLIVMGAPLTPGGARMLWLKDYNELFNYPADNLTPAHFLTLGWNAIWRDKWSAITINFGNVLGPLCGIVTFPFVGVGLWSLRRHLLYAAAAVYGVCLFGLMTLAFTFPGMRGGFFHSGAALLPFFFSAAIVGLDASVEAAARRLKHWQPEKSKPVFTLLLVLFAAGLTDVVFQRSVVGPDWLHPQQNQFDLVYADVGRWLETAADPGAAVVVNNPPGFYYFTGRPSIVIPNGGPDTLLRAARDFNARWVVLDPNVPDGLKDFYAHPASDSRLKLRHTFGGNVYIFQVEP